MLSFQLPFRPDEDYSSSWKLVLLQNHCTVPENTSLLQDLFNSMRNLHLTSVQIYIVIIHYYEWFWQNEAVWGYLCPEMIIRDLGIISLHVAVWPMAWLQSGSWETWKDMVTNEHLVKCVKTCLIDIKFAKCQNGMETRQCKYCLSISLLFRRIRAWKTCQICTWNGYRDHYLYCYIL